MLELREVHRFRGGSDAVVVPVEVVADRVNCALVLISCVHESRIHKAYEQRESSLRNETAETIRDEDATRVDTG